MLYDKLVSSLNRTLRNSDIDFWEKKIIVTSLGDYTGVSVKALTTSPTLNQLIEKKSRCINEQL